MTHIDNAALGARDGRQRVDHADETLGLVQLRGAHQIGFVQDDLVSEGDLFHGVVAVGELARHVKRVHHRGH